MPDTLRYEHLRDLLHPLLPYTGQPERTLQRQALEAAKLSSPLLAAYQALGGQQATFPLPRLTWPMVFDGLYLVLDEGEQFQRYRLQTLRSPIYAQLPNFPLMHYRRWARKEAPTGEKILANAQRWTHTAAERAFGEPAPIGDFGAGGSPGGKWLAWEALLQDCLPLTLPASKSVAVVRLSVYEELMVSGNRLSLGKLLLQPERLKPEILQNYLLRRIQAQAPQA